MVKSIQKIIIQSVLIVCVCVILELGFEKSIMGLGSVLFVKILFDLMFMFFFIIILYAVHKKLAWEIEWIQKVWFDHRKVAKSNLRQIQA